MATSFLKNIANHLPDGEEALVKDVILYFQAPADFFGAINNEETLKSYRTILLVHHQSGITASNMLDLDKMIKIVQNVETFKLGIALECLCLTAFQSLKGEHALGNMDKIVALMKESLEGGTKEMHIVFILLQTILGHGIKSIVHTDKIIERIMSRVNVSDDSELYFVCMEMLKLLIREKLLTVYELKLQKVRKEKYLAILCDLIEFVLPTVETFDVWSSYMTRNGVWEFLLIECQQVSTSNKQVFFLLQKLTNVLADLSIDYESAFVSFRVGDTKYRTAWNAFFTIAENLKGNQKHLILPSFALLSKLDPLKPVWKMALLERGFQNESTAVQFWCAEHVLKCKNIWPHLSADSHFVQVVNNTNFFEEVNGFHEFLSERVDLPIEKLQKSVPIYHFADAYLQSMQNFIHQDQQIEYLNRILTATKMCTNTKIRAAIIRNCVKFIWDHKLYLVFEKIHNLALLSAENIEKTLVDAETLIKINQSHLPIELKTKFQCSADELKTIDPKLHPEIFLYQPHTETVCEEIIATFTKQLEQGQVPTLNFKVLKNAITKQLRSIENNFESHILINSVNCLTSTAIQTLQTADSCMQVKNVAIQVIEVSESWSFLLPAIKSDRIRALNARKIMMETETGTGSAVASKFYENLSRMRMHLVSMPGNKVYEENFEFPLVKLMDDSLELVNRGGVNALVMELNILRILFQRAIKNNTYLDYLSINHSLERYFTEMMNYKGKIDFNRILDSFIRTIIWSEKINLDWFQHITLPYYETLLQMAPSTRGLANNLFGDLLGGLEGLVSKDHLDVVACVIELPEFPKLLITGLLFGDIQPKEKRIESRLCVQLNEKDRIERDAMVRLRCNKFLQRPEEIFNEVFETVKMDLVKRFYVLSRKDPRYFADSQTHREKLRICQSLCILYQRNPHGVGELYRALFEENNLTNVTSLLELIVAYFAPDFEHFIDMEFVVKLKPSALQSLFLIIYYRCRCTPILTPQLLKVVIPFTMGQHFVTRLYAQITVLKLGGSGLDLLQEAITSCLEMQPDKNYTRCVNDFRYSFGDYEVEKVFSLGNIFNHIPRITKMGDEDIIPHLDGSLVDAAESSESVKRTTDIQESIPIVNVQQKMIPKTVSIDPQMFDSLPSYFRERKNASSHLIVVASLLQKLPNLGGLARTCEIFNVRTLAISSLRHTEQSEFQSLSVTAEKWLNIDEVPTWKVPDYLRSLKDQGYVIVGAEQTADSKKINRFEFPKKTVLLLGEEKEGIPANLISMLDAAVEIPQFGVCRSLNVHVCASLFVWEYAKQNQITE